ncbi:MAG: hypothetical protein EBU49_06255 [Proteobacteria bacterium]|nr:hypothetical protein [Pseudomonadota bacterium]
MSQLAVSDRIPPILYFLCGCARNYLKKIDVATWRLFWLLRFPFPLVLVFLLLFLFSGDRWMIIEARRKTLDYG